MTATEQQSEPLTPEHEAEQKTELERVHDLNVEVFYEEGAIKKLIDRVRRDALSLVVDATDDKGRKELKSLGYRVARSKSALDNLGKEHVAGIKAKAKTVDAARKEWRDAMDALKAEVLKPVTAYEEAQKKRYEELQARIARIESLGRTQDDFDIPFTAEQLQRRLDELEALDMTGFAEFQQQAEAAQALAYKTLNQAIATAQAQEAERAATAQEDAQKGEAAHQQAVQAGAAMSSGALAGQANTNAPSVDARQATESRITGALIVKANLTNEQARRTVQAIAAGQVPGLSITY